MVIVPQYRTEIIKNYYKPNHWKLFTEVEKQLKLNGKACIVDAHSFSDIPFNRDLEKTANRPDFNIGTDSFHTPQKLIDLSVAFFKNHNHTILVDKPYAGSLVPLDYYRKNANVSSIMLEVNRKLYLNDNTNVKSDGFEYTRELVEEYLELVREYILTII